MEFFGVDRLGDFVAREAAAGQIAPETLRRLTQAILEHQDGALQDDATAVLVEWRGRGPAPLRPTGQQPAGTPAPRADARSLLRLKIGCVKTRQTRVFRVSGISPCRESSRGRR